MAAVWACPVEELRFATVGAFHRRGRTQPIVVGGAALTRTRFRILTFWVSHYATLMRLLNLCVAGIAVGFGTETF